MEAKLTYYKTRLAHLDFAMKKVEIRNLIFSILTPLFVEKGFRLKKAGEGELIRVIQGGFQRIGIPLVDHNPKFKFSLIIAIRLDAVADITNKFVPAKYHSAATTFTAHLERFMPEQETQFVVFTEEDIKAAFARLEPVIRGRIIPFLDETQDLATVAKAMNLTDIPQILPGGANKSALTIARLIRYPDFEKIAATYQQRISQYSKNAQEELKNFIQHLRQSH
jgi:hypothetical protein